MAVKRGSRFGSAVPWGMGTPPPPGGTDDGGGDVARELARSIRSARELREAQALGAIPTPPGPPAAQVFPQPATVQDAISINREARESASEMARDAREAMKEERERREAAEESAGGAFNAGQSQASAMFGTIIEIMQDSNKTVLELVKANADGRVAAKDSEMTRILEQINGKVENAIAAKDQQIVQEREKREAAETRAKELAGRKTFHETMVEALGQPDHEAHAAARSYFHLDQPQGASLEQKWHEEELQAAIEGSRDERASKRRRRLDAEDHESEVRDRQLKLYDHGDKVIDLARTWLETNVLATGAPPPTKAGLPHNGFPGSMEEMKRAAQEIEVAQRAAQEAAEGGAQ